MIKKLLASSKNISHYISIAIFIAMSTLLVQQHYDKKSLASRIENIFYDYRLRASNTIDPFTMAEEDTRVVIVDIDEYSLKKLGRWPWSRSTLGTLIESIKDKGAIIVSLDIILSEPEKNIIDTLLADPALSDTANTLNQNRDRYDADQQLAQKINQQDIILGYIFLSENTQNGTPPNNPLAANDKKINSIELPGFTTPIPSLIENALGLGFVTIIPDNDGIIRRAPLILENNQFLYPSLALETSKQFLFSENIDIKTAPINNIENITSISLDSQNIPTDENGNVLIPYKGGQKLFTYYSAAKVLEEDTNLFENTIVLIGTSAIGLADLRATPLESLYPGVEIHATIIDSIINNRAFPYTPDWALGANFLFLVIIFVLMSFIMPKLNAILTPVVGALAALALLAINLYLWSYQHLNLIIFIPLLSIILFAIKEIALGFFKEQSQRKLIRGHFDKYVPPAHIEKLITDKNTQKLLEGERKNLSVLFADIRNFTSISEALSVQELKLMLNKYFSPMTEIIFNNNGTVDKFVGDMIMAFWGAPLDDERHAYHSIKAALEILARTETLKQEFKEIGLPEISIGAGINSGDMNVGDMGSDTRRNYTVLGDSVNLGSRIEGLTKFYGVSLLVGEDTKKQAPEFLYIIVDQVAVKGKDKAVKIYEPLCLHSEASEEQLELASLAQKAFDDYTAGNFKHSLEQYETLNAKAPGKISFLRFSARLAELINNPPEGKWTGVYRHKSK